MAKKERPDFLWNTSGDWMGTIVEGHIWDTSSGWVGWVEGEEVFKGDGEWLGRLTKDRRIVRRRTDRRQELKKLPPIPERPVLPARATLPPHFADLPFSELDVLDEDPHAFKKLSDLKPDMD
jgi:hypothetical protein